MNNYGKHITRKRNTINIELILSNSNLEGERFKFELERETDRQTDREIGFIESLFNLNLKGRKD